MPPTGEFYAAIAVAESLDKALDNVGQGHERVIQAARAVVQKAIAGDREARASLRTAVEGMEAIHDVYCEILDKFSVTAGEPSRASHAGATGSEVRRFSSGIFTLGHLGYPMGSPHLEHLYSRASSDILDSNVKDVSLVDVHSQNIRATASGISRCCVYAQGIHSDTQDIH